MNSASSVSGNTVIAEPLKIVSPMRSPRRPAASSANCRSTMASSSFIDVETSRQSITSRLRTSRSSSRSVTGRIVSPTAAKPDDRQGGDLAAEEQVVAPPQPAEHRRRLGVVDVGDRHLVAVRRAPAPAHGVHTTTTATATAAAALTRPTHGCSHHHASISSRAAATDIGGSDATVA